VRRVALAILAVVVAALLYLALWPIPIDPQAWTPPAPPAREGVFAPNARLRGVERIGAGVALGPEATAIDADGRLYTGTRDGRILRLERDGTLRELARTGGRPLGMELAADGSLVVADRDRGLLRVAPLAPGATAEVEVLATEAEGTPFGFADDVVVAPDGTIYFTDASRHGDYRAALTEHGEDGRLLALRRGAGAEVLASGLRFANGLAFGPGHAYLLVTETGRYRVLRHWLAGPRRGTTEPFAENLPGFPDNVTWSPSRRVFWVALFAPRIPVFDALLPRPFLRGAVFRLPLALQPDPVRHAWIVALDEGGRVVESLEHEAPDAFAPVTSVREHGGWLWLGSLERESLGRIAAPPPR
jgi:sugar lactone lactonase YvrE